MVAAEDDFDSNPALAEALGDALGIGFKLPSNHQFEYMRMVYRALNYLTEDAGTPTRSTYDVIKEVYRLKGWNDLNLKFPDKFKLDFSPEEDASKVSVSAQALQAARVKRKEASEIEQLATAIKGPNESKGSNINELIDDRDRRTIDALKGKVEATRNVIAERVHAIEEHLGTFEFKVGKMCEQLEAESVDPEKKRAIIKAINNKLLAGHLEEPLPEYGSLQKHKYALANAIAAKYPNEEDKLGAFLKGLSIFKQHWGAEYPLAKFDPQAIKSYPEKKFERADTERNIDLLCKALKFNDTQKKLLWFLSCNEKTEITKLIKSIQQGTGDDDYNNALSILLDLKEKDIREALKPEGTLLHFGFLNYDAETHSYAIDKSLHTLLRRTYADDKALITGLLGPSPKTDLKAADYDYMKSDFNKMVHLLHAGLNNTGKADKVMTVYGPRGTGKTELTAVLADKLTALYEDKVPKEPPVPAFMVGVAHKADGDGAFSKEPSREERINDLLRKEFIIKKTGMKAFLVVDEADGLLDQQTTDREGSKAFMNTLLNDISVPTMVIFNHPHRLEEATKRRILPAFEMDYMPLPYRVKAIIAKTKEHTRGKDHKEGIELDATGEHSAHDLAEFAQKLSIAEIDRCIRSASVFLRGLPTEQRTKDKLYEFIHTQFHDTLKFLDNGIPPVPVAKTAAFHRELATPGEFLETCDLMAANFKTNPTAFAGKPFAVVGESGTGKISVARHIAFTITRKRPIEVHMDAETLKEPDKAYAKAFAHSARDHKPIIFTGADVFLNHTDRAKDFFRRISSHPQPVIFVANIADTPRESLTRLSKFRIVRTGALSEKQIKIASEKILQIKDGIKASELNGDALTIGDIILANDELAMIGKLGDRSATIQMLDHVHSRMEDRDRGNWTLGARGNGTAGLAR